MATLTSTGLSTNAAGTSTGSTDTRYDKWLINCVKGIIVKYQESISNNSSSSTTTTSTITVLNTNNKSILQLIGSVVGTSCSLFVLYNISTKYYKWLTSPLRNAPHPKTTFNFWIGGFYNIYNEPFMIPQYRWYIEAQEKVNEENKKQKQQQQKINNDTTTTCNDLLLNENNGTEQKSTNNINNTDTENDYMPFFAYSTMFGNYSLMIMDATIIQNILCDTSLSKDTYRYTKRYDILKLLLGKGLVTLEGNNWYRHRRIIQPSFQMSLLEKKLDECVPILTKKLINYWKQIQLSTTIDIDTHLQALTLDIIGQAGFSYEFNSLDTINQWIKTVPTDTNNIELNNIINNKSILSTTEYNNKLKNIGSIIIDHPFVHAMNKRLTQPSLIEFILSSFKCVWLFPYLHPSVATNQRKLDQAADDVIQTAKQTLVQIDDENSNDKSSSKQKGKSLLQLLLDATVDTTNNSNTNDDTKTTTSSNNKRNKLSLIELRDEAKTFLLAGHETTSTWCYWAIYVLSTNNDIQEKVYNNIINNCTTTNLDIPLTLDDINKMDYLDAFLNEVLRYHPPVGLLFRYNTNVEIYNGYTIPQNTRLLIPIHLLHRHPKYWGTDAEIFKPERWLENTGTSTSTTGSTRHPYCFIPFSAGLRNCVGYKFARIEAKLIMANLIRELQFLPAPCMPRTDDSGITLSSKITIKSKPLVKIIVQVR